MMPPRRRYIRFPTARSTWVFGLLETLEDRGGRDDGYKIWRAT